MKTRFEHSINIYAFYSGKLIFHIFQYTKNVRYSSFNEILCEFNNGTYFFLYQKNDTEISILSEIHFIAFELFEYFN